MKTIQKQYQGFTLIELLVVIVIIGVLTTIGTFAFMSSSRKSRDSKRKEDISQITKALELYQNDRRAYPSQTQTGTIAGCGATYTTECPWGTLFGYSSGTPATSVTYMMKLPKDPTDGQFYYFETTGLYKGYRLYARLENPEDLSIPQTGSKDYNVLCGGAGVFCNYVVTSQNVAEPSVRVP